MRAILPYPRAASDERSPTGSPARTAYFVAAATAAANSSALPVNVSLVPLISNVGVPFTPALS